MYSLIKCTYAMIRMGEAIELALFLVGVAVNSKVARRAQLNLSPRSRRGAGGLLWGTVNQLERYKHRNPFKYCGRYQDSSLHLHFIRSGNGSTNSTQSQKVQNQHCMIVSGPSSWTCRYCYVKHWRTERNSTTAMENTPLISSTLMNLSPA